MLCVQFCHRTGSTMDDTKTVDDADGTKGVNRNKVKTHRPQCLICGKNISDRRNLVRHLRRVHGVEPLVRKPQLKCSFDPDCTYLCATSETLRDHLKNTHNFTIEEKVLKFKCRDDFEKWKQEEELNTNARYVAYTGTKCRGTKKVYYLKCHRSGAIRSDNTKERKRSKPAKGYTQCGTTCPSSITVAETSNGSINAVYYPIHLGHTLDEESIQYMKLSMKEKKEIVGKLAQGEPVGKIVLDARKRKGSKLSRINLLQRRDVYNIKKKVNYLEKEDDHDGKMIDSWIQDLRLNDLPNNPVALYCPINETKDYTLVLIHHIQRIIYSVVFDNCIVYVKTKKGKPNVDFHLTTISVVCENGSGYPIAFCLSQKTEYITLYTFFKIVYQNFGRIRAETFVADNVTQYYLAWKNVMGECQKKLACTFGLETYWEQKLSELKCPVNKLKEVSSHLGSLLRQQDPDLFELTLLQSLMDWNSDEDLKPFGKFFDRFYANKRFEWADCYRTRPGQGESLNVCLEPLNRSLDSIYVESYDDFRGCLNSLFAFVRDVCLVELMRLDESITLDKGRETEENHVRARSNRVDRVKSDGSEWVVTDDNSDYVVRRSDVDCDKKCGLFCEACNVCTHNYNCVCSDYVTGFNICRHVHAVGISTGETNSGDLKGFSVVGLKRSAVALGKSLAAELDESSLTEEKYGEIIAKMTVLKEDIVRNNKIQN